MSLREWIVTHVPLWLSPLNPWGDKGRPALPEQHAVINKQQELSLRIGRLDRLRAQARLEEWREQQSE